MKRKKEFLFAVIESFDVKNQQLINSDYWRIRCQNSSFECW
jgi:hypothetical protein